MAGRWGMAGLLGRTAAGRAGRGAGPGRAGSGAGWLALSCQSGLERLLAGAAQDRGLLQGGLGDPQLAAARALAGEQVPRGAGLAGLLFGVAPELERGVQVAEDVGVDLGELVGDGGLRPAGLGVLGDVEP